jgi:hypothetical protein
MFKKPLTATAAAAPNPCTRLSSDVSEAKTLYILLCWQVNFQQISWQRFQGDYALTQQQLRE